MNKMSSRQFRGIVKLDPTWASRLTESLEITGYCDLSKTKITHLSPLLLFSGRDKRGYCASFSNCEFLNIAEGNFTGYVSFSESGIEKIGDLNCIGSNYGTSASFHRCKSLMIAQGNFQECVDFSNSGIKKIKDLTCGKSDNGYSAFFDTCESLEIAEGNFPGFVSFRDSGIREIKNLTCGKNKTGIRLDVSHCKNLSKIPTCFNPKEIGADPELLKNLREARVKEAAKKVLSHGNVEI